jgi:hypothetical protein
MERLSLMRMIAPRDHQVVLLVMHPACHYPDESKAQELFSRRFRSSSRNVPPPFSE